MKKTLLLSLCAVFSLGMYARTVYVNPNVTIGGTGVSWETGTKTIAEAISLAVYAGTSADNIYVMAGTYAETINLSISNSDNVSIYGGYSDRSTGTDITLRDIISRPSIINGTRPVLTNRQGVLITKPGCRVDGFTIQNCYWSGYVINGAAGVQLNNATSIVSNCIIKDNQGAAANYKAPAGGVYVQGGTLEDCTVTGNSTGTSSVGAGIRITQGTVNRCKVFNNDVCGYGGGIGVAYAGANGTTFAAIMGNVTLSNNVVYNNNKGGVYVNLIDSAFKVNLVNNTIVNNQGLTLFEGAGITKLMADLTPTFTVTNNIFHNNFSTSETFAIQGTYTYNAIQHANVTGTGNVALTAGNTTPVFMSPSTVVGKSADASVTAACWGLGSGSLAKNAGLDAAASGTLDANRNVRLEGVVDMGAYEAGLTTAPGMISAVATGAAGTVTVSFAPPSNGEVATGYTVYYTGGSATGTSSPITVTGLTNFNPYTFTVTATTGAGESPASAVSNLVIPYNYMVPTAPTAVSAIAEESKTGEAKAKVYFSAPLADGNTPITLYTVTSNPGGIVTTGTISPISILGLTNDVPYTFTVTATNAIGVGATSAVTNSVTPFTDPLLLLKDNFENGKGSWLFSGNIGNSYDIIANEGYNMGFAIENNYIGNTNFIISPAVTVASNKAYKVRFDAYNVTASRRVDVYYNTSPVSDGNDVFVGSTPTLTTAYKTYTLDNIIKPISGTKYIILKVIDIVPLAPTYTSCYIDNFKFIDAGNFVPTLSLTSPAADATFTAGTNIPVEVTAADEDGTVASVELYFRGAYYSSKTTPPYSFSISNLPIGASTLSAKVFDNVGDSAITSTITINGVNVAPTCTLTEPTANVTINQGAQVTISATASDSDGTVASVAFFVAGSQVFSSSTAPFTYTWSNPNPGVYPVFAVATDNTGLTTTSVVDTIFSAATTNGYLITEAFEDNGTEWVFSTNAGGNDWKMKAGEGINSSTGLIRNGTIDKNFIKYYKTLYFSAAPYTVKFSVKASAAASYTNMEAGLISATDTIWSNLGSLVGTAWTTQTLTINCPKAGNYTFMLRHRPTATQHWVNVYVDDISVSGAGGFPNAAPIVRILTPAAATEIAINTPLSLTAAAYDMDGTIAKVEYFVESDKIGEATAAPYTVSWTPTYSGVFALKAKATDNEGKTNTKELSVLVNYADRKVYDFAAASYLGGEAGSGKVYGTKILSDGVVVLACDWGTVIPDGAVVHLLNGATINSRGAVVRLAADGKKVLSITKIGNYAVDLSVDTLDNIFVAAGTSGMVKLNRLADRLLLSKTFPKNVYRIDAGKSGYSVVLTCAGVDFDGKKWPSVAVYVMNPAGEVLTSFGGASDYTNDVCIDEASQSAIEVGWRNIYTGDGVSYNLPVDIPGFKIYSFAGIKKFEGYNWNGDNTSPNWINASDNNMADTRIARCSMGDDGLLYFMAEVSGGNHPLRYSPYDIQAKVRFVGGDHYHTLSNVGTEFHAYVARMNIATGAWIEGQSFTARLSGGTGNTIDPEHGNVTADADGRVYFTGKSAYGAPLSKDLLPEISYTGGALIYIMNASMTNRELVSRVVQKQGGRDVDARKFPNHDKTIVYGGEVSFDSFGFDIQAKLYAVNPVQSSFYGTNDQSAGFFALIGGTQPKSYNVIADGVDLGANVEATKINLSTPATRYGGAFSHWTGGKGYITDSTALQTVLSVPGRDITVTPVYNILDATTNLSKVEFKAYPNPTCEFVRVETGTLIALPMTITDMTGKIIYADLISANKTILVNKYQKGMYVLTVGKKKQKLVIY